MIGHNIKRSMESRVFRRLVPIIGLIAAGLWTGSGTSPAWAQVNIDQGKSPAEMFNGDCGTCHKSAKGLANGRNSGALAGFLREHYTSSAQQAASLAAFVLGAGAGAGPASGANLKPGTAGAEAKPGEAKPGDKGRPGRPDPATTAKLQPSTEPDAKTETAPANEAVAPGRKPPAGKRDPRSVTASRGARQEPEAPPPAPEAAPMGKPETAVSAPVATAPAAPESAAPQPALPATAAVPGAVPESSSPPNAASSAASSPSAPDAGASGNTATASGEETQGEGAPAENAPVPRDDIPD
jgi:hypothetical protein